MSDRPPEPESGPDLPTAHEQADYLNAWQALVLKAQAVNRRITERVRKALEKEPPPDQEPAAENPPVQPPHFPMPPE